MQKLIKIGFDCIMTTPMSMAIVNLLQYFISFIFPKDTVYEGFALHIRYLSTLRTRHVSTVY